MPSTAGLDCSHQLHPLTLVPSLLRDGETVARRGRGGIVENDRGRELIEPAASCFTTSGHPACAAAALANLNIVERENLVARAGALSAQLLPWLIEAVGDHPLVGDEAPVSWLASNWSQTGRPAGIFRLNQKSGCVWRERRSKLVFWFVRCLPTMSLLFDPRSSLRRKDECVARFALALDRVSDRLRKEAA
jgi:hypothetical protein